MPRKLSAKRLAALLDAEIEAIYRRNFSGVTINIFDIPKIFNAARAARAAGADMEAAIVEIVSTLRKN